MKFICDNCKAKYQIGDEKVAGKMVRMKCRRCGHLIQVSASVTESSVAQALPVEPPRSTSEPSQAGSQSDDDPTTVFNANAADGGLASLVQAASSAGASAAKPGADGRASPPRAASKPPPAPPRPVGAVPRAPAAPRVAADTKGSIPRPASAPREAHDPAARAAGKPQPFAATFSAVAPAARTIERGAVSSAAQPTTPEAEERPTTKGGTMRAPPSEDWYVGIGGVPLGPVRLAVIREKALAGVVDGESLVWREGFEEWQPLKTFPELLEIVTEAQAMRLAAPARRTSSSLPAASVQPAAAAGHPSGRSLTPTSVPAAVLAAASAPALAAASAPARDAAVQGSDAGLAAFGAPAAAFLTSPADAGAASLASPAGAGAASLVASPAGMDAANAGASRAGARPAAAVPIEILADPFAPRPGASPAALVDVNAAPLAKPNVTLPSGAPAPISAPPNAQPLGLASVDPAPLLATPASLVETVSPRRRAGLSPIAYAFIAMAAAFGGVSAFVLLSPRTPSGTVTVVTPPSEAPTAATTSSPAPPAPAPPDAPAAPPAADERTEPAPSDEPKREAPSPPSTPGDPQASRPQVEKPSASAGAGKLDMSGFSNPGVPGPSSVPGGSMASTSSRPLSQGEISTVVEQNRASVRRRCWQPALDARSAGAPSTARVSASVVIGSSGAVQSVTAIGSEKDYPGLSSCIASRIRSWKFPPSSGSSTVSIPFVFASQ